MDCHSALSASNKKSAVARLNALRCHIIPSSTAAAVNSSAPLTRHMLIIGGNGVVGRAAVQLFDRQGPEWHVTAVSKDSTLHFNTNKTEHVCVDLTDAVACRAAFNRMVDVTDVIYAAMFEKADDVFASFGSPEEVETNDLMMRNFLKPLLSSARRLKSVQIVHGAKAYGAHKIGVDPTLVPWKEQAPRIEHGQSFYWRQEDFLKEEQSKSGGSWAYTIWRPPLMFGYSSESPFNFMFALAVHAVVMRELGRPLAYPGSPALVLSEFCDCRLQARAFLWAATAPTAANQTFNISNGDAMIWQNVYPKIASFFGMESAPQEPTQLCVEMMKQENIEAWARVVKKHGLVMGERLDDINAASFRMADFNIGMLSPVSPAWKDKRWLGKAIYAGQMQSTISLRQAGFYECMDTADTFLDWFREMQELRVIPK